MSLEARHPRNHPRSRTLACISAVGYSRVELSSESSNGSLAGKHLSIDRVIASINIHTDRS